MGAGLVDFINASNSIGQIINASAVNLTGAVSASLIMILIILVVIALMFAIPLEFLSVIILPFVIAVGAYYNDFITPLIIILIYIATLIAKNWLFR